MKRMDIEKLLQWAYTDELIKGGTDYVVSNYLAKLVELGTRVDDQMGRTTKLPAIFGDPHPDAIKIAKLVRQIGDIIINWEASGRAFIGDTAIYMDHDPLARQDEFISVEYNTIERRARPIMRKRVFSGLRTQVLLVMHAKGKTRPDWRTDPIQVSGIKVQGGKYRVVGKASGSRRGRIWYSEGSYCPLEFTPRPETVAIARAEYWAWWRGLVELANLARGQLSDYEALPPKATEMPWR